ncbi:MAG TPA: F0F1 ATP synthase subunit gamma [Patescibacteria group bacterium]|nr:F0F1 ATP synthase subunit gamma [Patescibacteria group bacterium]
MMRPQEITKEVDAMHTLVGLTSVFEGIASMHISQIKDQVLESQDFFSELWNIYSQIRVGESFHYGRGQDEAPIYNRDLYVVITAEGGFSGDIDQRLIEWMLKQYDKTKQDIVVVGHHGAIQLAQQGIGFKKYFKLPDQDVGMNVEPLIKEVLKYQSCNVFYQTYVSLAQQDVKRISLSNAVQELGKREVSTGGDIITEQTYIFEPNTFALINHLERSMMQITVSQVIFDSKLAQYASRFRAMTLAHQKADDTLLDFVTLLNRAKRAVKDERLKETINGLRHVRAEL